MSPPLSASVLPVSTALHFGFFWATASTLCSLQHLLTNTGIFCFSSLVSPQEHSLHIYFDIESLKLVTWSTISPSPNLVLTRVSFVFVAMIFRPPFNACVLSSLPFSSWTTGQGNQQNPDLLRLSWWPLDSTSPYKGHSYPIQSSQNGWQQPTLFDPRSHAHLCWPMTIMHNLRGKTFIQSSTNGDYLGLNSTLARLQSHNNALLTLSMALRSLLSWCIKGTATRYFVLQ